MILRGIHIEHWRCIARLELSDLPAGVIILHGPNGTGKSSLVRALRGCLLDLDHDTTRADFKSCLPVNGAGPPRVVVEFQTGGEQYRLTKVFSRKVDGLARLEKSLGGAWRVIEEAPKEASRKVRELLRADTSDAGLNQLLWLDQGTVALPDIKELDGSLEQQLMNVLGVMVTGRDLAFKQGLDELCLKWFGARGTHKPKSPVNVLEQEKTRRQEVLAEQQGRLREVEQARREMDDCESRLPDLEKSVADARRDLQQLAEEREQSLQRRQQFQQAEREVKAAEQALTATQARLQTYHEAKARWQESEQQAAQADAALQVAQQTTDRFAGDHDKRVQELQKARQEEETHQAGHEQIDDCRKLLTIEEQRCRLAEVLKQVRDVHEEVLRLEQEIQGILAPDRQALEELRANRTEAVKLRAELQAAALTLAVTVQRPEQFQMSLDGGPRQAVDLRPEDAQNWPVLQRVRVEIPALAIIEVARGREDRDLERSALRLDKLDRAYKDSILAFKEQPGDDACLDRLAERRLQREDRVKKLAETHRLLDTLAPQGSAVLESGQEAQDQQRQIILNRRSDLADWQPSPGDVSERERLFLEKTSSMQKLRKELEKAEKQANYARRAAEADLGGRRDHAITVRTTARNLVAELRRLGDELSLQEACKQTGDVLRKTQTHMAEVALTDAEKTVEHRYQVAAGALKQREERLRMVKEEMIRLRGYLQNSEGLHTRLGDAETALREIEIALEREILEAEAHKHLRDLFEQSRDNQVQQVTGPIGGRILDWARSAGLNEYQEFRFGERFLPEGLVLKNGAEERMRALTEESYGIGEQLSLLVRLALGGVLAKDEPALAVLDDPLAHADPVKHRHILDIIGMAAAGNASWTPPAGPMQIIILTCHPERFDYLTGARQIDLAKHVVREQ